MKVQNIKEKLSIPVTLLADEATRTNPEAFTAWKADKGIAEDQELVEFEFSLGAIIFDLYTQNLTKPASPLAVKKMEAEVVDLAKALTEEEFELSEKVLAVIKTPLSDDSVFVKTSINAVYGPEDKSQSMSLYAGVMYNLPKTLATLTSLYPQG